MTAPQNPRLRDDVVFRQVDEDFVVYDPVADRTTLLNASAAAVLDLCDGSRSPSEIAAEIERSFSAVPGSLVAEVDAALEELASHGLLAR